MENMQETHQRTWQGIPLEEDLYGRIASSLLALLKADRVVAYLRRRTDARQPWGPPTVAFQRGQDALPQDAADSSFHAIGPIEKDTWQLKLSVVRHARSDPFGGDDLRLAQHLVPLLEGAMAAQEVLDHARDAARNLSGKMPAAPARAELNLTHAEADVLDLLLQGYGVKQISQRRHSSYHTVRSQLASLLSKANCHSQRELILRMQMH